MGWEIQNFQPDLQRPFLDVLFFNEKQGIATGAYGLFYRTLDGGKTWTAERHASLLDPMDQEYLEDIRKEDEDFYQQEIKTVNVKEEEHQVKKKDKEKEKRPGRRKMKLRRKTELKTEPNK